MGHNLRLPIGLDPPSSPHPRTEVRLFAQRYAWLRHETHHLTFESRIDIVISRPEGHIRPLHHEESHQRDESS
jgi:hypothetical protein